MTTNQIKILIAGAAALFLGVAFAQTDPNTAPAVKSGGRLYDAEGFEKHPNGPITQEKGWTQWDPAGNNAHPEWAIIQEKTGRDGSKALVLTNTTNRVNARLALRAGLTDLTVETEFKTPQAGTFGNFQLKAQFAPRKQLLFDFTPTGRVRDKSNPVVARPYPVGEWVKVVLFINQAKQVYELGINGKLVLTGAITSNLALQVFEYDYTSLEGKSGFGLAVNNLRVYQGAPEKSLEKPNIVAYLRDYTDPAKLAVAGGENASLRQARKNAFGVEEIQLNGIMGQRMMFTRDAIHLMDTDAIFVAPWRDRRPKKFEYFNGVGHMLEGLVLMAAYTGDPRDVALKDRIIDSILATQEADGYVGRFAPGERGRQQRNHDTEDQAHFLRAVAIDSQVFGSKPERRAAAERMARWVMDTWVDAGKQTCSGFDECFFSFYQATGDRAYLDFLLKVSFPGNTFSTHGWGWQWWTGYDPASDTFDLYGVHVYRACAIAKAQLEINRVYPHPQLPRTAPEIVGWVKDGGASLPGVSGCSETFSKSQFGRVGLFNPTLEFMSKTLLKVGEACSHVYLGQFLETDFDLRAADCWHYDVIERILYNAIFAAQSKEARPEWDGTKQRYEMPFEGPRSWFETPIYCCPNNFRKYIGQLPRLMYKTRPDGIYVNLYEASRAVLDAGKGRITVTQETAYPRDGKIVFRIDPERETKTAFHFRIPAWCARPSLKVNGKTVENVKPDSYAEVSRTWKKGDVVELDLPMQWRWISGIRDQDGRAGLTRGPLVFALNPVLSMVRGYHDLAWEPEDYRKAVGYRVGAREYAEYQPSYDLLQNLVIDAGSLSAPVADRTVFGDGIAAKVKAWSRPDKVGGKPDLELTLTEFADEGGRKTYFLLNDKKVAQPDPLFARELKERTLVPKRWETAKVGLDLAKLAKLPFTPSADDLLVPALRSSGDEISAPGEVAGHRAWMSVSELNRPYRKMGFRMPDDRYLARTPARVQVTIVYLDRGDCDVQVFYDSTDKSWLASKSEHAGTMTERVKRSARKGAFKPAAVLKVGDSGQWRTATLELKDARFATESAGKDLFFYINKNEDFIVQGVYVRELKDGN